MYIPRLEKNFELAVVSGDCTVVKQQELLTYCEMDGRETFIFEQINGDRDIEEIALEYYKRFNVIGHNAIVNLLSRLYEQGLLLEEPPGFKKAQSSKHQFGFEKLFFRSLPLNFLARLMEAVPLRFFATKAMALLAGLLSVLGFFMFSLLPEPQHLKLFSAKDGLVMTMISFLAICFVLSVVKSFGTAVVLVAMGRNINAFSLRFAGFIPYFAVNAEDALMLSKPKRIAVFAAPLLALGIVACPASAILYAVSFVPGLKAGVPHVLQTMLYQWTFLCGLFVFFGLSPFYASQGVGIFKELFGLHTGIKGGLTYLRGFLSMSGWKGLRGGDSSSTRDMALAVAATWWIAALFGLFDIATSLFRDEAVVAFRSMLLSDQSLTSAFAAAILISATLPPVALALWALVLLEKLFLQAVGRHRFLSPLFVMQPVLLLLLPVERDIKIWVAAAVGISAGVSSLLRAKAVHPAVSINDTWVRSLAIVWAIGILNCAVPFLNFRLPWIAFVCFFAALLALWATCWTLYLKRNGTGASLEVAIAAAYGLIVASYPMTGDIRLVMAASAAMVLLIGVEYFLLDTKAMQLPKEEVPPSLSQTDDRFFSGLARAIVAIDGRHLPPLRAPGELVDFARRRIGISFLPQMIDQAIADFSLVERMKIQRMLPYSNPPLKVSSFSETKQIKQTLRKIPLLSSTSEDEIEALCNTMGEQRFNPGECIIAEGDEGRRFYALLAGTVAIYKKDSYGLETKLGLLHPGDCFGEISLLHHVPRTASVLGESAGTLLYLDREPFEALTARNPGLKEKMATAIHRANLLREVSIFSNLTSTQTFSLAVRAKQVKALAGEIVVREGAEGKEFFIIVEGKFDVFKGTVGIATLGPSNFFGEIALMKEVARTATVRAQTDGLLLSIGKADFLAAMSSSQSMSASLENIAANRGGGEIHA